MQRDRAFLALLNYFKQQTAMNVHESSTWIKSVCNEATVQY